MCAVSISFSAGTGLWPRALQSVWNLDLFCSGLIVGRRGVVATVFTNPMLSMLMLSMLLCRQARCCSHGLYKPYAIYVHFVYASLSAGAVLYARSLQTLCYRCLFCLCFFRSAECRVGVECRIRWSPHARK